MYLEYFSLKRHPFRITPDPSLFFPGGAHGRGVVLDALVYGIMTGEGILKVVGEVGSGKTMLCRMLEEKLPANVEIVYLANPSLSARDIIYAIAFELKLDVDSATDRLVVMHKLQDYLLQRHADGASVVVFIEEAQSMPLETLEEIRLLSNLETHRHKLMQIVLFGQPELDEKLDNKAIRQLRERITHSFYLQPLNPEEVREYLHFRLRSAGCPWPQLFSPAAEKLIARASGGLTRRINILADKSLLASYADPLIRPEPRNSAGEIQAMVLPRHVRIAIADSGYGSFRWTALLPWSGYVLAAAALVALGVVLWQQPAAVPAVTAPVAVAESASVAPAAAPQDSTAAAVQLAASASPVAPPAAPLVAESVPAAAGEAAPALSSPGTPLVEPLVPAEPVEPVAIDAPKGAEASVAAEPEQILATAREAAPVPASPELPATPVGIAEEPSAPLASASDAGAESRAPASVSTVTLPATGLARKRSEASAAWLAGLAGKSGYTIQLFGTPTTQGQTLEEFLEFLELTDLLDASYVCVISGNARRPEQWLVLHGEFAGLSETRRFIEALPPYIKQYQPYTRNLDGIACAQ